MFRDLTPANWLPDPRVCAEREQARFRLSVIKYRSMLKQRIHSVRVNWGTPCPVRDLFGVEGRRRRSAAAQVGPSRHPGSRSTNAAAARADRRSRRGPPWRVAGRRRPDLDSRDAAIAGGRERQQHREATGPLDQRADRRAVQPEDQIAFPVTGGRRGISGLRRRRGSLGCPSGGPGGRGRPSRVKVQLLDRSEHALRCIGGHLVVTLVDDV